MLLYLSSNENIGIFDFLSKEKGIVIKKLAGEFYLKKFVIHDMRNLSHYSYFAIDLKALKDNDSEIMEAILAFKTMYDSRIIIFADGANEKSEILQKLLDERIYNIVTSEEISEIKDEIIKCICEEGKTQEDWKKFRGLNPDLEETIKNKYMFKYKNIKIAVAGASSRVGTTTAAFNMTKFLFEIGAKISYTEANGNEHLKEIAAYYEFQKVENYYKFNGIEYYPNRQFPDDYNFNIFDLGSLNPGNVSIFNSCDIKVLCSRSKPYELIELQKALTILFEYKFNILFSLTAETEKVKIRKRLEVSSNNIFFQGYSPSMFDGNSNETIYKEIVKEYIIDIVERGTI